MRIGVLAVQGAFKEHIEILTHLKVEAKEIRNHLDLSTGFDGLILPGGESTVMGKLLNDLQLFEKLKSLIKSGIPVFGTCAGLILLAATIENDSKKHLATMNINVLRNAYGRQLGSFNTTGLFNNINIEMPFIRAPLIKSAGKTVEILSVVDEKIVAAKEKNQLVTTFHPELTSQNTVHEYFLSMIRANST